MEKIKQDILKVLEDHPSGLSINDIAKYCKYHRNTISPRLRSLLRKGNIKVKTTGKSKLYYLKHHAMIAEGAKHKEIKSKKNIFVGTGISKAEDPYKAGKEAVEMAIKKAGKAPDFGLVFFSAAKYGKKDKDVNALAKGADDAFKKINPKCKWVGASARAEVSDYGFSENSVVAAAISSNYIRFGVGVGINSDKDPEGAGRKAAAQAVSDVQMDKYVDPYMQFLAVKKKNVQGLLKMKPYFIMTIFPGPTMTYLPRDNAIINGIERVTGVQPTFGGDAGEDWSLTQTYTLVNGRAYKTGVVVVSIVSDLKMGFGVAHGYKKDSEVLVVTKAKGNIVYELNGEAAAQLYIKRTGTSMAQLKKFFLPTMAKAPMGITDIAGNYWINCPYAVGDKEGLVFFEPVKEGTAMCIMKTNPARVLKSAESAIKQSTEGMRDLAVLFVFTCSTRMLSLKEQVPKETQLLKKVSKNKPFVGFYTYAEHAMLPTGSVQKHGFTFVCGAISNKMITE
ncbi:MAG: FIST C-terminal domain-containing protein [Candidatus Woesearchaeota archaeon]|nr:MAG: FIST C-terminal domain-containing protein [Candidatus Woesearchaeota archaeon]